MLAAQTTSESNPYIPSDSALIPEYLVEHDYAVQWAIANRNLVAHRVQHCLFPQADEDVELKKLIDVTHNSVSRASMTFVSGEDAEPVWIHRKGAAPADKGPVPCPGSRGDFSWLLAPSGDGNYNGTLNGPFSHNTRIR
jgi:release factor H-coupled RctB family protein